MGVRGPPQVGLPVSGGAVLCVPKVMCMALSGFRISSAGMCKGACPRHAPSLSGTQHGILATRLPLELMHRSSYPRGSNM